MATRLMTATIVAVAVLEVVPNMHLTLVCPTFIGESEACRTATASTVRVALTFTYAVLNSEPGPISYTIAPIPLDSACAESGCTPLREGRVQLNETTIRLGRELSTRMGSKTARRKPLTPECQVTLNLHKTACWAPVGR